MRLADLSPLKFSKYYFGLHRCVVLAPGSSSTVQKVLIHSCVSTTDKLYAADFTWTHVSQRTRAALMKRQYLAERWTPTSLTYPSHDTEEFSRAVQRAVLKILTKEKIPVKTSGNLRLC